MQVPRPRSARWHGRETVPQQGAGTGEVAPARSGALARGGFLIGPHDALHQRVANNIALVEEYKADLVDLTQAVIREKVGPIETEYSPTSPQSVRYRAIDMALAPYLTSGSGMARLVRA